ncbi:hypothetical protein [Insolitispirillum peregrinum]|uniref:hypothetical protein n=1 Tax=Insolitispirillum peregrinum TaxID=80876 RepID=UPI00360CC830
METLRAKLLLLDVMRAARQKLVEQFLDEDPSLFRDILRSRKGGAVADILLERHFLLWHSMHFNFLEEFAKTHDITGGDFRELATQMASIIRDLSNISTTSNHLFLQEIISERAKVIDLLVKSTEKSDKSINKIMYIREKESLNIERIIEKISHESGN